MTDQLTRPTDFTISCLVEIPESLHEQMQLLADRKGWDSDRLIVAALSLFILQETSDRASARVYLNAMFDNCTPFEN
jgi:Protein of unknown function (DUF2811)